MLFGFSPVWFLCSLTSIASELELRERTFLIQIEQSFINKVSKGTFVINIECDLVRIIDA